MADWIDEVLADLGGVLRQRQWEYGAFEPALEGIAARWSARLGAQVDPIDVAIMMGDLKEARLIRGVYNMDTHLDRMGYAAMAYKIAKDRKGG